MSKSLKNTPRDIIREFAEEIIKARTEIANVKAIPFRDDKVNNKIRKAYKVPIELLRFRKDNGRISSDVLTWESSKGPLNELTDFGQATLRRFLEAKDPEPTEELMNSLIKDGQDEEAVITADGFLINGNRRKMAFERLLEKYPGNEKYKYLKVIILPGLNDSEPPTTLLDIEQLENRLQHQRTGKAEYYNFDKALSIKRKIEIGMSLEEQLSDDPNFSNLSKPELNKKIREFEEEYLKPLECIDKYLEYLKRPGHYNTISEGKSDSQGRWQAFLDYYKLVYKKLSDEKQRMKLGVQEDEVGKIENVAFKIIRKRELSGLNKKAHQIMRDIPKLVKNPASKSALFKLINIDFELTKEESTDEEGKQLDEKTKDVIWGNKYASDVIDSVRRAYDFIDQKKEQDYPIDLLNNALDKIILSAANIQQIEATRVVEAIILIKEIQLRANELENSLSKLKRGKDKLQTKIRIKK
jgi:hypothetical protein